KSEATGNRELLRNQSQNNFAFLWRNRGFLRPRNRSQGYTGAPRNRYLLGPRSQRPAKPPGSATETLPAPPQDWVLEAEPVPGRRRWEETVPRSSPVTRSEERRAPPPPAQRRRPLRTPDSGQPGQLRLRISRICRLRAAATENRKHRAANRRQRSAKWRCQEPASDGSRQGCQGQHSFWRSQPCCHQETMDAEKKREVRPPRNSVQRVL
ncbi:hypothetical protein P7K49_004692, partial [Saguinus oedipus]